MQTPNGNFIEKALNSSNNTTIKVNIKGVESEVSLTTMIEKFLSELPNIPTIPYYEYNGLLTITVSRQTSGILQSGSNYIILTLETGDDFSNVGYTTEGAIFTPTDETNPTDWTNGTAVYNVSPYNIVAVTLGDNTITSDPSVEFSAINQIELSFDPIQIGNYSIESHSQSLDNAPFSVQNSLQLDGSNTASIISLRFLDIAGAAFNLYNSSTAVSVYVNYKIYK